MNPTCENYISVLKGGNSEQGTWIHRKLAIELARWLNTDFSMFTLDKLDTLFQTGKVELISSVPQSYAQALLEAGRIALELENKSKENEQLNQALDNLLEWVSIIKVANLNKVSEKCFNWRLLKAKSIELDLPVKRAESPRFGFQNLYSLQV